MNWGPIRSVWGKELRDTVRDRRTLLVMIIMPVVLTPLLIVGAGGLMKSQIEAAKRAQKKCLLVGTDKTPELDASLQKVEKMEFQRGFDARKAEAQVRDGEAHVAVVVGEGAAEKLKRGEQASVTIVFKGTLMSSQSAYRDLESRVEEYAKEVVKRRLKDKGVREEEIDPIPVTAQNVATPQEMGSYLLGFIVPMLVLTWSIVGGMYTAMDVSAGEKERNTLEALLLTPASRLEVTLGKLMAVSTVGFFTMVAALGSMYIAFLKFPLPVVGQGGGGAPTKGLVALQLTPLATLLMLALSMLLVISFSSLMVGLGIFARSVKEAQNLIMPVYLGVLIPIMIASLVESDNPSITLFMVPAVNAVLLFKELLKNQFVWLHVIVTALTLLACVAGSIAFTLFNFRRETVLFKS
ncbi:MAG: ABC transporter permease [Planctomycetota bacterium]